MKTTSRPSHPDRREIFETTRAIGTIGMIIWKPGLKSRLGIEA